MGQRVWFPDFRNPISSFYLKMIICPQCHSEIYDFGAGSDESVYGLFLLIEL